MSISDFSAVFGMIAVALTGAGTGAKYYGEAEYISRHAPAPYDDVYLKISTQNLKLLYDAQDELAKLETVTNPTNAQIARIATLRERIRNLK